MEQTDRLIVEQLRQGTERAYRYLYDRHYAVLCHVAATYVKDDFLAETIVGDVIFHLWEVRDQLTVTTSLRSYLVQSVRHRCLDYLKSQRHRHEVTGLAADFPVMTYAAGDDYPLGRLLGQELEEVIMQAIDRLPAECRRVFRLSRFEGRKNSEIAAEVGISVNTVKYHIKRALAILHQALAAYMTSVVALLVTKMMT